MAKEDFCYTYYDGDAARDKAHMDRLERGAYDDLISLQRKVGPFTLDQAKKVLSKDFVECWPAQEMILKTDEQGRFFIDWLKNSVEKSRAHSIKQKIKIDEYWNKKRAEKNQADTTVYTTDIPNTNHGISPEEPLEDGNGYVLGFKDESMRETIQGAIVPEMVQQFMELNPDYAYDKILDFSATRLVAEKISKWLNLPGQITDSSNRDPIKRRWGEMVAHIKSDPHLSTYSLTVINKHFQRIAQSLTGKSGINQQRNIKTGKQAGANQLLASLRADLNAGGEPGTVD